MDQPAWLRAAWAELGVREGAGVRDDPRVVAYYREAGHGEIGRDEVPWCAAFLGAMLRRAGAAGSGSLLARSYLNWGEAISEGRLGAIAVLTRGADPNAGHVGFLVGATKNKIYLLGGNQDDAVSVAAFDASRVLAYRWPELRGTGTPGGGAGIETNVDGALDVEADDGFADALLHVLEMEGGFSDDPYDPGGPTNRGITLAVYARFKGESVDATSRARLVEVLKRIPDDDVRAIYGKRYWEPAKCEGLPPAVALFHFDAAVNHGVRGAALMLQQAAGVQADGEIGPETLSAVAGRNTATLIDFMPRSAAPAIARFPTSGASGAGGCAAWTPPNGGRRHWSVQRPQTTSTQKEPWPWSLFNTRRRRPAARCRPENGGPNPRRSGVPSSPPPQPFSPCSGR